MTRKSFFLYLTLAVFINILIYYILFAPGDETHGDNWYHLDAPLPGNLPDVYLTNISRRKSSSPCGKLPDLFDLKIRNDNWQIQKTSSGTFQLFSGYLDERNGSVVRILGTYDQYCTEKTFHCQLYYNGSQSPVVVPSEVPFWLYRKGWGADTSTFDHPYLISCPVSSTEIPVSVSLVEQPCDLATNNLKITQKRVPAEKKNFVVCVKGLSFPFEDTSARLAEWIELLYLLGAEKINFYEFNVHPNAKKVLDYYESQGRVEVTPVTLVGDVSNRPKLQNLYLQKKTVARRLQEVIPYNDCLYKHLAEFKYVVLLDSDEVVVPVNDTWVELIDRLRETAPNASSYIARNVYFLDSHMHQHEWFEGIPRYMHILQHVNRAREYTKPGYFVKGFHDTEAVLGLHNHYPFACLNSCSNHEIDVSIAHLQHYRADCVKGVGDCKDMKADSVLDMRVWRFKDELIEAVERTFRDLKFFDR